MVMEVAERVSVCAACGGEFRDGSRTSPRSYCYECRPLESRGRRVVPAAKKLLGEPFTVPHFRLWASGFKLKDGSFFELEDFEALFLEDLFAREADGSPTFAELWLVIPEGNGKTTFLALVILYTIEFKPEAWVPVAASARDQAVDLTYRVASGFAKRNGLDAEQGGSFRLHPGYRQIVHSESLGSAKIFASDAASGDGVDPDLAVIEELHRLAKMDLYETWAGKLDKSGGQLVIVSTAGEPGGAFEEMRERIRQSAAASERDGCFLRAVAPGVVLHEYAIPEDGDPEDLELVALANPFSGKTVEALAKKRAKPSWNLAHWRRFTCNLPTRSGAAAISEAEWHAAATAPPIPAGEPIWVGLDVAWKWDTTALVPMWWKSDEERILGAATILEPPRDGNSLDPGLIEAAIHDLHERNPIHTVVMDPSKAEQLAVWISDVTGATVVERAQTNAFATVDYAKFMEALRLGWLKHNGDPGLTRHVFNAVAKILPGGDARFDRPAEGRRSGEQRVRVIDALTAASMVHSEAALVGERVPATQRWGAA